MLSGIDLAIPRGHIVGLLGENGAGKSTLMNILAGALAPSSGQILFDGAPVELGSVAAGRALGIRFVHQELSTAASLSVAENVFLGGYLAERGFVNRRRLNAGAREVLARVGLGHVDPRVPLGRLRSGEQQLVELGKAIAEEPRLLILDEPTSSLTPAESDRLFTLAHELAGRGVGIILITHRLEEALAHCDRVVVLRDGQLIVDRPARGLGKADLIVHMVGRPAIFTHEPPAAPPTGERLRVAGLCDGETLAGIDMSARGGEVVGLFGLVGAGRTEFLETLYGFRRARGGAVWIDGAPMPLGKVTEAARRGLFMLPEGRKTRGILPTHSVRGNISISCLAGITRAGLVDRQAERRLTDRMAGALNIRMAGIGQPITALSGGNQQKALFARALLAKPKVLLLDEPTHGVDVGAKAEIHGIIRDLAADGTAIVVASSELPEILAIADRCLVFAGGRVVAELGRDEMSEAAILRHAFALRADARQPDPPEVPAHV
ncbi:sugar ABC transporter ATP-binding protein [Amaricoccus solimangrovi]|uniref:Sugar ABC transporter ATP-binding protein n=1 Tax=Amaricoccus solimangrovi TaxID=2589815 RepID=A0A501WNQ0_9RHOB|nr:sugar ABC transporter ATP-binding protein [Amaricoccus solimangrovi]